MINQVEQGEKNSAAKANAPLIAPVGKIIVVDDEPELMSILVKALTAQGFEVTGCSSGQEALAELRQKEFDLLLTDLMMPEMDGIALMEAALKIDPHLIGIMMTGQGTIQTAVDAMKVGAFDYVLKPFRLQTVMPVLTRAINTRRLRMENLQLRETVAIYSLCQTISFTLDAQTVLSRLADAALQQSDADEVSILLPTSDGQELFVAAVRGEKRQRLLGERVPLQASISSWVARERTPLILNGEVRDERFVALWPRPEIRSAVSVPMQLANKLVGIINLNLTNRLRPFTLGQMKALTILASTAAAALESASLYAQLRTTEEKYRSIFENATEGLFQTTPEGQLLTANPALARIFGYHSPEEMTSAITDIALQLYVNPKDRAVAGQLQEQHGAVEGFELEAYRKDGKKIWLSLNRRSVRNQNGEVLYFEGSVEDITGGKLSENQLKRSEERYRELVENAHDLIYEHDLEGNFTATNKAGERITGYSLEETLKLNLAQIVAPDYLEKQQEMLRRKLAGESIAAYDLIVIARNGRRVPVEVNTRLVFKDGVPVGVQGIARDITERKRVEEIQARRAAQALFRADVSAALTTSRTSLRETLESCATAMVEHLGAAFARIWTLNSEEETLELQASAGMYTHLDGPHSRVAVGSFKIGKIAQERSPHITNEVQTDPRVGDKEWARREGMVAFAGYPLLLENRVLGVMAMFSRQALFEDTLDALASVADLISHGIERKRTEEALRDSEVRKRAILESAMDCIITMDHEGLVVDWNPAAEKTFGYSQTEVIGRKMAELIIPERFREQHYEGLAHYLSSGEGRVLGQRRELSAERRDGTEFPIELTITRIELEGAPMFTGYLRDITERKKAENRLSAQYAVTRALAESNTISEGASTILQAVCESLGWEYGSLWTVDRSSNLLRCSQVWQALGVAADEFESTSRQLVFAPGIGLPGRVWNNSQPVWIADVAEDKNFPRSAIAARVGLHGGCAFPIRFRSETLGVVEFLSRSIREPDLELLSMMGTIGSQIGQFIESKRVEEALSESEEQLRQSQKLEAIGQLAGGVAHDFNNLLTVIGGYSSILLGKLPPESPHRGSIEEIKKASDRASALTRQLLAFSRKQILQPKVLDLNIVVTDLEKMVRRLIGEDIDLLAITSPVLGKVRADPGQIEQVLLNLIVNARDAMPKGGKLTIETRNVVHSEEYAQRHAALPGPYVMLAVSDTGCGMDATIQPRVFEPFFTTKGSGQGTGLGLATVYGIVKQSGGNIWIYSEVDRGSTFKVYLPRVDELTESEEATSKSIPQGTEMVLLVEDEAQVRAILQQILEDLGYQVLAASNGDEAFSISQDLKRDIKLMITDVVMPQMSGRELAERVLAVRPNLPVLFMSGYTDDAIVRHGLLDEKLHFIQKPFDSAIVARKVREVLDSH